MPAARETVIGKFVNQILFKVDKSSINEAKSAISEVKSFATKALGVIGIGFSFTQLSSLAEEFGGINDAIRGATRELGDQSEIQQKILKGAQDCREEYGAMAGSVTKLIQQNGKLFPVDDAVEFVSLVEKLEKGAGREANIDSTMDVLTKAMSSGKLDKTGFANLKSKAPEVVKAISSAVGVSEAQLQKLAESGKLSAKQLKDAFFASESEIQKNFDELGFGITDALKYVRNEWGLLIANLDDTFGITTRIGKAIRDGSDFLIRKAQKFTSWLKSVADKLGGVEQLLKLIALAATALFLATNGNKILSFLSGAVKLLKGFNIQTALAAAKWLLLFLVLEDVFTFLQGGDSVFGRLLSDAGVDVDALREKISDFFSDGSHYAYATDINGTRQYVEFTRVNDVYLLLSVKVTSAGGLDDDFEARIKSLLMEEILSAGTSVRLQKFIRPIMENVSGVDYIEIRGVLSEKPDIEGVADSAMLTGVVPVSINQQPVVTMNGIRVVKA